MICGMCGSDFEPAVHNQRWCSTRCKRDSENEARRVEKPAPVAASHPGPKILIIDIEVAPAVADVWGLWDQRVGLNQIRNDPYMLCFAAKWFNEPKVFFNSVYHNGKREMVAAAADLMDEADILVHYNGAQYDVPHLKREILLQDLAPPSPFKQVDLYKVAKSQFRWISNKLQYVSTQLGLAGKAETGGHELWVDCMNDDASAWTKMKRYNKQDVVLTEQVYAKLRPWIVNHPHAGMWTQGVAVCPRCGSSNYERRGQQQTSTLVYQRLRCHDCGGWFRGTEVETRAADTRL